MPKHPIESYDFMDLSKNTFFSPFISYVQFPSELVSTLLNSDRLIHFPDFFFFFLNLKAF